VPLNHKQYELTDHLGNVRVVVSSDLNKQSTSPVANILATNYYYPFVSSISPLSYNSEKYRFGFNGKEKGDYGFRIYNPGIAKFLSVDPLTKSYPWYTPYQFAGNKPVWIIDLDGLEEWYYWKSFVEYTKSAKFSGPLNSETMNQVGFHTLSQVHKIEQEKVHQAKIQQEGQQRVAAIKAKQLHQMRQNPVFGALEAMHKLGPTGSGTTEGEN